VGSAGEPRWRPPLRTKRLVSREPHNPTSARVSPDPKIALEPEVRQFVTAFYTPGRARMSLVTAAPVEVGAEVEVAVGTKPGVPATGAFLLPIRCEAPDGR